LPQSQVLQTAYTLGQTRSLLQEQTGSYVPIRFLVVMVFWLTVIFTSFGLFAPKNPAVIAILIVCALSVSGAIYLILGLDSPFTGLMRISEDPPRNAIAQISNDRRASNQALYWRCLSLARQFFPSGRGPCD
jgi:hypothetical protein